MRTPRRLRPSITGRLVDAPGLRPSSWAEFSGEEAPIEAEGILGLDLSETRATLPDWVEQYGYDLGEEIERLGETGVVGTWVSTGHIQQETNLRYSPMLVRGQTSNPGIYEELWRSEPLIFDAIQSHTEMLTSGIWRVQPPTGASGTVKAWCEWMDAKREHIASTWSKFLEDAASFLVFGFAPFELVWDRDPETNRLFAADFAFREQSTVYEYAFDVRGDRPLAVRFESGGDNSHRYILPFTGPMLTDHKLMWVSINGRGNNLEGVSPLRPSLHYVQAKQVLQQIAAASAEKYGAPMTFIRTDPAYLDAVRATVDDETVRKTREAIDSMQAVELGVFELPDGLLAETVGPPGQMPELINLIQYYDQMIVAPLSNEGSLLGLQAVQGSYALGEVKERDFLASGPANARRITDAFNRYYLWPAFRHAFPAEIDLPRLTFRLPGLRDRGSFVDNIARLFPNMPLADMPEAIQRALFDELGLELPAEGIHRPEAPLVEDAAPEAPEAPGAIGQAPQGPAPH